MRSILILLFALLSFEAWGLCNSPIARRNVNIGEINYSSVINTDFNTLYTKTNTLSGDCIAENSIPTAALIDESIGTDHFANGVITIGKFAPGVFPAYLKLIRIKAYVTTATWVRGLDVKAVMVQMVGAGGASYSTISGGLSRFGLHCTANGGTSTTGLSPGVGGTAYGGDINLTGGDGFSTTQIVNGCFDPMCPGCAAVNCRYSGDGGKSMLSFYGNGGNSVPYGGGGGGGYCAKLIPIENLNSSEAVTVGVAPVSTFTSPHGLRRTGVSPATGGIVIIYEFGE